MTRSQKSSDGFSPTRRQLMVIYFLATTLFIGTILKVGMDRHWWLPETVVVSGLKPEDVKMKFDINAAPWYELALLPKLGETKAKAITAYRERYGNYKTLDELYNVKGIGRSIMEAIREYIKIGSITTSVVLDNRE